MLFVILCFPVHHFLPPPTANRQLASYLCVTAYLIYEKHSMQHDALMIQFCIAAGAEAIRAVQQRMARARVSLARGVMKLANCTELSVI